MGRTQHHRNLNIYIGAFSAHLVGGGCNSRMRLLFVVGFECMFSGACRWHLGPGDAATVVSLALSI